MGLFKKKGPVAIAPPTNNEFPVAKLTIPQEVPQQPTNVSSPTVPLQMPQVQTQAQPEPAQVAVPEPIVQETRVEPQKEQQPNYIEVPTYLSQDKINELIIQNNLMLRQILSMASEDEQ